MRKPRTLLTALMLLTLLALALPGVSLAQGNPNEDCPNGTVLVAKFELNGGGYVFEKPAGNESVVTISNADANGGDWSSTVGISHIIVKGGTSTSTAVYSPAATSGTFSNDDLALNPSGYPPAISNIQFCAPGTGSIIIIKDAEPESDRQFSFTTDIPGAASFSLVDDGSGSNDRQTFPDLIPGSYNVTEVVPDGWNLDHIVCVDPDQGSNVDEATASIDLDAGETVVCTFYNEAQPGTIIIKKVTDPEGGEGFSFTDNIAAPNNFTLGDGGMQTFNDVAPGSYTVTEDDPLATPGQDDKGQFYDLVNLVCEDSDAEGTASTVDLGARQANINLDPGETVTCTFTNEKQRPSAIRLIENSFAVQAGAGSSVTIAWETGTEIDNVGYNLYRATSANGPWDKINDTLIAAQGDALFGASYSFVDRPGRGTFYYRLEDVDYYGVSTLYDPVTVDLGPAIRAPWFRPSLPEF